MGYCFCVVNEAGADVECDHCYVRRGNGDVVTQAEILMDIGMGSRKRLTVLPTFPTLPETVYWDPDQRVYVGPEMPEYTRELHAYLKNRRGVERGIAVYKLTGEIHGFWVTREECREALDIWQAKGCPHVDDLGDGRRKDFIPFLRAAVEHSGFRVW